MDKIFVSTSNQPQLINDFKIKLGNAQHDIIDCSFIFSSSTVYIIQDRWLGCEIEDCATLRSVRDAHPTWNSSWAVFALLHTDEIDPTSNYILLREFVDALQRQTPDNIESLIAPDGTTFRPQADAPRNDAASTTPHRDGTATSTSSAARTELNFFSDNYKRNQIYTGVHRYHASPRDGRNWFNPDKNPAKYRIGVELETIATNDNNYSLLSNMKSNIVFQETDSSLGSNRGIEFITTPLNPKDATCKEFWDPFISQVLPRTISESSPKCGLHVHIGREIMCGKDANETRENLGKLLYFYYYMIKGEDINTQINGRSVGYNERNAKTKEGDALMAIGKTALKYKEVREKLINSLLNKSTESHDMRYCDINITNDKTIEFRLGKGTADINKIIALITYYETMCNYVKDRKQWTKLSLDDFIKYTKKNISADNPLRGFLPNENAQ